MADNRFSCSGCSSTKETVCIETNRVLDSCRDRDCFENVRVYLSECGNRILEQTGSIRAKSADIMWTNIGIDPIQFNRGFYAVTIRFYIKLLFEACIGCGHSQEMEGVAVLEKKVILYGGECNVNIFKSSVEGGFCKCPEPTYGSRNVPTAVLETVDPVILGTRIVEKEKECNCCCCCHKNELSDRMMAEFEAPICFDEEKAERYLAVSLGIFSVVRIVRPGQYLISASEYAIPEKECISMEEDNPCNVFQKMPFPVGEFCSQMSRKNPMDRPDHSSRCGC